MDRERTRRGGSGQREGVVDRERGSGQGEGLEDRWRGKWGWVGVH